MKKLVASGRSRDTSRLFPWLLILTIGLVLSLLGNALFAVTAYERSRVVSVPDGDSLDLADGRRIRLLGIDAPEKGRCMADEARGKLVERALGRHVRLKEIVTDDFGRQLAIVFIEDLHTWISYLQWKYLGSRPGLERVRYPKPDPLLQRVIVTAGLARNKSTASSQYNRVLRDAQETAKSNKLGIWSDACRGETSGKGDCTIKGNVRAGKKQYYLTRCPAYPDVIVDTSFGDRWFCSENEAMSDGFSLATSCK